MITTGVKKENKPRKRNDNEFDVQTIVILTKDTDHPYLLQIGEYVIEYLINRSHTHHPIKTTSNHLKYTNLIKYERRSNPVIQ